MKNHAAALPDRHALRALSAGLAFSGVLVFVLSTAACDRTREITGTGDPPVIQSATASPQTIPIGEASLLTVVASDPGGGSLSYEWDAGLGDVVGSGAQVYYSAQWCCLGPNDITVRVINEGGGSAVATLRVTAYAP